MGGHFVVGRESEMAKEGIGFEERNLGFEEERNLGVGEEEMSSSEAEDMEAGLLLDCSWVGEDTVLDVVDHTAAAEDSHLRNSCCLPLLWLLCRGPQR